MEILLLLALLFATKKKAPTWQAMPEDPGNNKLPTEKEIQATLDKLKPPAGMPVVFRSYPEIPGIIQATINNKLYKIQYVTNGTQKQNNVPADIIAWLNYWWTLPEAQLVKDTGEMFKLMASQPQVFNNARDLVNLIRNIYGISPAYSATSFYTPVNWPSFITITQLGKDPILNTGNGTTGGGSAGYGSAGGGLGPVQSEYKQSQGIGNCMA